MRVGTALLTSRITGVGQGREGSIDVLVRPAGGSADELARRITAKLGDDPLITKATVEPVAGGLLVVGYLGVDPESSQAVDVLVPRVRTMVAHEAAGSRGVEADVDGVSAFNHDLNEEVGGDLWKVMVLVLVLCYLVLLVLLRSVLLPLKAVIMNLLSIGAAYGVIVMVFQWGWLDFTGYHSLGHINTLNPALMLAITFGLAMDYEVFLLSRIRERYAETGDNARAVEEGLASSASDHHLGRADHDHGVRQLRADRRAGDQGDRARAWRSRSSSTPPSRGSCWCPRRCGCWASGTGGCRTGSTGSCRTWPTSGPCPSGTPDMLLRPDAIASVHRPRHRDRRPGRPCRAARAHGHAAARAGART